MTRRAKLIGIPRHLVRFTVLLVLLGASVALRAQLPTATVLGAVKDSSGAVVPGATVTARNVDTGQTRAGVTGADGSYRFPALAVGSYEIHVEQAGFRAEVRRGLTLTVAQEAVVNFTLQVGNIEQTVAVTAEAPLVNTTSGSLGGLVDEQRMADLPLNGRNYIELTLLQTGITNYQARGSNPGSAGTSFSSNGAPLRSNSYLLDGASMVTLPGATSAAVSNSTLGVEGIREFRVITNSFSAEYGMTMGSQMLMVSKGGTNTFHGSAFEYLRNSALDARNFFDLQTATTPRRLPAFTRNNFGGSGGGPLRKDKTFLYGVYEGLRERLGVTKVNNTIPLSARVDGGLVPQISPVIKPLLPLFPDPNLPNGQFTAPFSQPTDESYGQMRADQTFSNLDTLFVRYTVDDAQTIRPIINDYPQFKDLFASRSHFATLSEGHVFSPSVLNTFRFSFSRTWATDDSPSGILGPQFSLVPGREIGNISIGGVITAFGPTGVTPNTKKQNIFTWSDDLFYTRGRHSLKFGALINRFRAYMESPVNGRGTVSFANLTSFLLAQTTSYTATTPDSNFGRTYHYTTLGFYAQDDLRLRSNFTLNLGLRYEFNTEVTETNGLGVALRDIQHDAATTLGRAFQNLSLRNLSPRIGFAWDVNGDGRTAVRGGFGLLYDIAALGPSLYQGAARLPPYVKASTVATPAPFTIPLVFPPESLGKTLTLIDYWNQQPHMLQYNLTVERQLPFQMAVTLAYGGSRGFNLMQMKEGNPTVPQILPDGRQFWPVNSPRTNPNWSTMTLFTAAGNSWYNSLQFGLVKRLSKGLQFQSSYTWSQVIDETQGQGTSEATLGGSVFGSDPTHRDVDRGRAIFDVPHNWRFNALYRFPELFPRGALGKALQGWWMSGILALQSGPPFAAALSTSRSRSSVNGGIAGIDRPDLVVGRNNSNIVSGATAGCLGVAPGRPLGTPQLYFDPCAFAIQPAGFLGTAGRNILRGPGFATLDFSLVKDTPLGFLGEGGKLEFRAEFFNILNRVNFQLPNKLVFAARADVEAALPTAGLITSTVGSSRQIQLALKVIW